VSAFALVTLRRLARPWFLLFAGALAGLAARGASDAPGALDAAGRAQARTQAWSLLLFLAPFLAHAGAALARPEALRAWLAGGARRGALALGGVLGTSASGAGLCLVLLLASELALDGGGTCQRLRARPASPVGLLHADDAPLEWSVPRPAGVTHARLALGLALGSGASTPLCWSVRDGGETRRTEVVLGTQSWLTLELPPAATGELHCTLERRGPGAVLVLAEHGLELVAPAGSERRAAATFALHAALALALVLAATQLFARLLAPFLASLLALALFGLAASRAFGPAGALVTAFHELALGRAPSWPGALAWLCALLAAGAVVLANTHRPGRASRRP
jgi:hypothetical protein